MVLTSTSLQYCNAQPLTKVTRTDHLLEPPSGRFIHLNVDIAVLEYKAGCVIEMHMAVLLKMDTPVIARFQGTQIDI